MFEGERHEIKDRPAELPQIDRTAPVDDVWQRIRHGFAVPDLDSALVREKTRYYAARPDYLQRIVDRSRLYLYHIVEEIEKRGMPTELALLPMVESAFNPMAYSRAHASGLWQFIPGTGRRFELEQNWWYDGAARHRRVDQRRARLPHQALRDARRLAARARLLQLGRERGGARHRQEPRRGQCRPTTPA